MVRLSCALVDRPRSRPGRAANRRQRRRRASPDPSWTDPCPVFPAVHHIEVVMRRYIVAGLVLAVLTTLLVVLSDALGLDTEGVALLGGALGGALGLVPDRSPAQRAGAFVIGFLAAWVGYALRAAVLPDATAGRAIAVLLV